MLAQLVCAHLVGDFLLQNDWMQRKSKSSLVCTIHVIWYSIPFWPLEIWGDLPPLALGAILVQHWLQDRYSLHMKWMVAYGQTTPDKWPVGPLCIDQAWHIGFLWIIAICSGV